MTAAATVAVQHPWPVRGLLQELVGSGWSVLAT
jgi:hypothetical protein